MNKEEIIKNNISLAKFLGGKVEVWEERDNLGERIYKDDEYMFFEDSFEVFLPEELEFHKNWDSLMQVVERIESINDEEYGKFSVNIHNNVCDINSIKGWLVPENESMWAYMSDPNAIFPTKIESTYYNVVKFVEWYNELLKNRENGRVQETAI